MIIFVQNLNITPEHILTIAQAFDKEFNKAQYTTLPCTCKKKERKNPRNKLFLKEFSNTRT